MSEVGRESSSARSSSNLEARIDDQANDKAGHYQSGVDDWKVIQLWKEPVAEPRGSEANDSSDKRALTEAEEVQESPFACLTQC